MAICTIFFKRFSFSKINCGAKNGPFIPGLPYASWCHCPPPKNHTALLSVEGHLGLITCILLLHVKVNCLHFPRSTEQFAV